MLELSFQDMAFEAEFDGIWACASLLHVPSVELPAIIGKLKKALKAGGILFTSFKYGDFEGERNGRYFYDLTEEKAEQVFKDVGLKVEKMWITEDVRPERVDEKWLNVLCVKTNN